MNNNILTKNKRVAEQKVIARGILQQATDTQKNIVDICIDQAYLEGIKVGLEEAKKIYRPEDLLEVNGLNEIPDGTKVKTTDKNDYEIL